MTSFNVVQVSDTHISQSHAYFIHNWECFLEEMDALRPDLVVHSGDVTFNGPDAPEEIAFGRAQLERLPCPYLVVPGNHDVGEPPPVARLDQPVTEERMARWSEQFESCPLWCCQGVPNR